MYEDDGDGLDPTVPPTDEFKALTISSNLGNSPSEPSSSASSIPSSASAISPHLPPPSPSPSPSHPLSNPKAVPLSNPHPILLSPLTNAPPDCPPHPLFATEQLGVDRRLLVNRKRQLKMYRVWMQGKFRKLSSTDTTHKPEREGSPGEGIVGN